MLEMVYACFKEHPYNRITPRDFTETLHITQSEVNFHAVYLEEKGLLELQKPLEGNVFVGARITPQGIDLCEDEYRLDVMFPAADERKPIPDNVFLALDALAAETKQRKDIAPDDADIILHGIDAIKQELRNDSPRFSIVKKHVDGIMKKHAATAQAVVILLKAPPVTRVLYNSFWE